MSWNWNRVRTRGASGLAVGAAVMWSMLAPAHAQAQSCQPTLQSHVEWVENQSEGTGTYSLGFVVVSNRLSQSAAYAEGQLTLKNTLLGKRFSGTGTYYLNTERWTFPCPPGTLFCIPRYPFDPDKADPVTVSINPSTGRTSITTGGATRTLDLTCDHFGVLHGAAEPTGLFDFATPMYVFSLKRQFLPVIY